MRMATDTAFIDRNLAGASRPDPAGDTLEWR